MRLIDTHAHLDEAEFQNELPALIERAAAAGVETVITIGTTADSSAACVELVAAHPSLRAAIGIQPNYCAQAAAGDWDRVVSLVQRPGVVAIGETGLDRHWDYTPFDVQQDYFDRHIRLAQERDLPFVVHTRESDADVLVMLRDARTRGPLRGVMHSFTGTWETAEECISLGMHISFAGMVTFKKSQPLREVAARVPDEWLLVETDSPYLSPHPLRGKRNEPANVVHTAHTIAECRGQTLEAIAAVTTANAERLFGLA